MIKSAARFGFRHIYFFSFIFVSLCLCRMEAQTILKLVESLAVYDGKSDLSEFIKKTEIISKIIEWEIPESLSWA